MRSVVQSSQRAFVIFAPTSSSFFVFVFRTISTTNTSEVDPIGWEKKKGLVYYTNFSRYTNERRLGDAKETGKIHDVVEQHLPNQRSEEREKNIEKEAKRPACSTHS